MEKPNTISIEDALESSDVCINHFSLIRREIRELRREQNPSVECAICDGCNYNCPEYSSVEERNH